MSASVVKEELQEYLDSKKLNAIFVSMVEAMLVEKPDNPILFIVKYLKVRNEWISSLGHFIEETYTCPW